MYFLSTGLKSLHPVYLYPAPEGTKPFILVFFMSIQHCISVQKPAQYQHMQMYCWVRISIKRIKSLIKCAIASNRNKDAIQLLSQKQRHTSGIHICFHGNSISRFPCSPVTLFLSTPAPRNGFKKPPRLLLGSACPGFCPPGPWLEVLSLPHVTTQHPCKFFPSRAQVKKRLPRPACPSHSCGFCLWALQSQAPVPW